MIRGRGKRVEGGRRRASQRVGVAEDGRTGREGAVTVDERAGEATVTSRASLGGGDASEGGEGEDGAEHREGWSLKE